MLETMDKANPHNSDASELEQPASGNDADVTSPSNQAITRCREPAVADPEAAASRETLISLLTFVTRGGRPESESLGSAWPALLSAYRDLDNYRHDFPLCLPTQADQPAVPLCQIIDQLLAESEAGGDAAEQLKRDLYRLEAGIKKAGGSGLLSELWSEASETLLASLGEEKPESRERIQNNLRAAGESLTTDGELLFCGQEVPGTLAMSVYRHWWHAHCEPWRERLDGMIHGLEDILRAEFDRTDVARSPGQLRDSVGTADAQDMDFDRLSDILGGAQLDRPLPVDRHARIERVLNTLQAARPLFDLEAFDPERASVLPFTFSPVVNDCREAIRQHQRRMQVMASVFRDAEIADLELANRYREERHDPYFKAFDEALIDDDQRQLCPPVVLLIDWQFDSFDQAGELLNLLVSGIPVKLVAQLDVHAHAVDAPWPTRLAGLARSMDQTFVFQGSASDPSMLQDEFERGLKYAGPAVFSVYTGLISDQSCLPAYLDCAAALESRAVPAYRCDPGAGNTQAERMHLLINPNPEDNWSSEAFEYDDAQGETQRTELPFTIADHLACNVAHARHFWAVPCSMWHPNMLCLADYLEADPATRDSAVAYLKLVTAEGEIVRVVPDRYVLAAVERCLSEWCALQEICGINNSHARNLLAAEQQRLAQERDQAIDENRARYEQQLDQDVGELTEEIVARIAGQLLGTGVAVPAALPTTRPAVPVDSPAAGESEPEPAPEEPAEEDEAEEESFALDDPYIDTTLCTTCDDCTTMSPEMFAYDENKQAYIKDATAGTFSELVLAAEKCPVNIIHPGKPANPDEKDLSQWIERARPFQ
jgi:ferredoxin